MHISQSQHCKHYRFWSFFHPKIDAEHIQHIDTKSHMKKSKMCNIFIAQLQFGFTKIWSKVWGQQTHLSCQETTSLSHLDHMSNHFVVAWEDKFLFCLLYLHARPIAFQCHLKIVLQFQTIKATFLFFSKSFACFEYTMRRK